VKTAFVIFDDMTVMDFIGIYDPLTRLKSMKIMPEFEWNVCALRAQVADDKGLRILPDSVAKPLNEYDLIVVPGGMGTRKLQHDEAYIKWLRSAESAKLKASVCTGALLLGAAGFLRGRRATTHPSAYEELKPYCAQVIEERVVDEGDIVTARGVTSGIDLGLHLVERLAGAEARARVARQMDYPYTWPPR
jgi:transcriptional regulator GlxA family with amidase domain